MSPVSIRNPSPQGSRPSGLKISLVLNWLLMGAAMFWQGWPFYFYLFIAGVFSLIILAGAGLMRLASKFSAPADTLSSGPKSQIAEPGSLNADMSAREVISILVGGAAILGVFYLVKYAGSTTGGIPSITVTIEDTYWESRGFTSGGIGGVPCTEVRIHNSSPSNIDNLIITASFIRPDRNEILGTGKNLITEPIPPNYSKRDILCSTQGFSQSAVGWDRQVGIPHVRAAVSVAKLGRSGDIIARAAANVKRELR